MKKILSIVLLVGLMVGMVDAPVKSYYFIKVRITAYSPKAKGETYKNATGGKLKEGDIASRMLPLGTRIELPNGKIGVVKDRPSKWAHKKFNGKLVDVCYIASVTAKPKTRAVNKQLYKLDMNYDYIKVYKRTK